MRRPMKNTRTLPLIAVLGLVFATPLCAQVSNARFETVDPPEVDQARRPTVFRGSQPFERIHHSHPGQERLASS